jgi:phage-related baseplate assembly protein
VTYTFAEDGYAAQMKDANGRRTEPGQVTVTALARAGNGTPSAELLQAVEDHFARDDVRPETDQVIVQAAEIVPYQIAAIAYINPGPDAQLTKEAAEGALGVYAAARHRLASYVDPSRINQVLHDAGAERLELLSPLVPIECEAHQAPFCIGINVEVRPL